jgi:hypothetical protein
VEHFQGIHSEILSALNPYTVANPAVSKGPYRISGMNITDSK